MGRFIVAFILRTASWSRTTWRVHVPPLSRRVSTFTRVCSGLNWGSLNPPRRLGVRPYAPRSPPPTIPSTGSVPIPLSLHPIRLFFAGKMTPVIRFASLALALALVGFSVNASVIPRVTVDYRRHDINVRIVEETRSIPSVASPPRFIARRRGVRDFRVPNRFQTRQTLRRPEFDDAPDVVPIFPEEERNSAYAHTVPVSPTVSATNKPAPRDLTLPYTDPVPTMLPRNAAGLVQLDLLNTYYQQMLVNSGNLRTCPSLARALSVVDYTSPGDYRGRARGSRNDPRFRDDAARELRGFRDNMDRTQGLLGNLGRDKGLANYDRNNDLETLLKDIVNLNKDTLSSVTDIVYEIPILGPILGPSEYAQNFPGILADSSLGHPVVAELKCIIDEVLNTVENTVDGLLNDLGVTGQWRSLRGDYAGALCEGGLEILGLCVNTNIPGLGLRSDEDR
jgi:hypothetical protein